MELDDFIARVTQRPLPTHPMARIRTLAKELAEGSAEGVWDVVLYTFRNELSEDDPIGVYLKQRWNAGFPSLDLLIQNDFLRHGEDRAVLYITKQSFQLVEEVQGAKVFISYKRSDSSAFALLVLARLKEHGIDAFLDLTIQPGDNWQAHLKQQIETRNYMVLLLGKDTLKSDVVLEEIRLALDAGLSVMPIWHGGFTYQSGAWDNIPVKIDKLLSTTHTIRVLEESALAYNNAIVELLNRFGVTP